MMKGLDWKPSLLLITGLMLFPTWLLAGAKEDLSITPNGTCSTGGIAFFITNNNSSNTIHATVTQSSTAQGQTTVTTVDITLQAKQQQQLGCSAQGSAGNFLVTWQVQSAQYQ